MSGLGFELATSGLKPGYKSDRQPTVLPPRLGHCDGQSYTVVTKDKHSTKIAKASVLACIKDKKLITAYIF